MPSVLVLDDDLGTRETFCLALRRAGFEPTAAETGREAIGLANTRHFDVILADIQLPDISGVDVLRAVQGDGKGPPVVMITAFGSIETAVQSLRLGAYDYVEKPISNDDLVETIGRASTVSQSNKTIARPVRQYDAQPSQDAHVRMILETIQNRYWDHSLGIQTVAGKLQLSVPHLCRLMKRETGTGFRIHLMRCRIHQGQLRLSTTVLPIKEVAFRVGYTRRQFDRNFQRLCGVSPLSYRRSIWRTGAADQGIHIKD